MTRHLTRLADWYRNQCNGDWEHSFGVHIETLDNPGWLMKIDLSNTPLEKQPFLLLERGDPDNDASWMVCKVEGKQFVAAGGAGDIEAMIDTFLSWAGKA